MDHPSRDLQRVGRAGGKSALSAGDVARFYELCQIKLATNATRNSATTMAGAIIRNSRNV